MRAGGWLILVAVLSSAQAVAAKPWRPKLSSPPQQTSSGAPAPPPERSAEFRSALDKGLRLLARGRYPEAGEALEKAVSLCPNCPEARLARVRALLAVGYLSWKKEAVRQAMREARAALQLENCGAEGRRLLQLVQDLWRRMTRARKAAAEQVTASGAAGSAGR